MSLYICVCWGEAVDSQGKGQCDVEQRAWRAVDPATALPKRPAPLLINPHTLLQVYSTRVQQALCLCTGPGILPFPEPCEYGFTGPLTDPTCVRGHRSPPTALGASSG